MTPRDPAPLRRVVFHVGLPKTGTTSIQAMLHDHVGELAARAVHVVTPGPSTRAMARAADRLGRGRLRDVIARALFRRRAGRLLQDLRGSGAETAIVSNENLLGVFTRSMYDPARIPSAVDALVLLRDVFASVESVSFVLYERDLRALHRSAGNQRIRKKYMRDLDEWNRAFPDESVAGALLAALREAGGAAVEIVSMEREASGPGYLGEAILRRAGAGPGFRPRREFHENRSG